MPKVIEGLEQKILASARTLLLKQGAEALTIRAVAAQCGVAVGTVYHYYEDKAQLMAHVMLEDWKTVLQQTEGALDEAQSIPEALYAIWRGLNAFVNRYRGVWAKERQPQGRIYHPKLIEQIGALVTRALQKFALEAEAQVPAFLAENLLRLAMEGESAYRREEFLLLRVLKK